MDAGELRLADGEVVDGSRVVGTSQWNPPELPERPEQSFDDRRGNRLLWVLSWMPEVGKVSCCSQSWVEASGDLLEAW